MTKMKVSKNLTVWILILLSIASALHLILNASVESDEIANPSNIKKLDAPFLAPPNKEAILQWYWLKEGVNFKNWSNADRKEKISHVQLKECMGESQSEMICKLHFQYEYISDTDSLITQEVFTIKSTDNGGWEFLTATP